MIGVMARRRRMDGLAQKLAEQLLRQGKRLALAESCTGGMIAAACTDLAGSSRWFDRGFVTYSNVAKIECLDVPAETLERHGAVSEATVIAMAKGTLEHSSADITLSVSGIAGPDGGSEAKPVGTVWFALSDSTGFTQALVEQFAGDRKQVREQAVQFALKLLIEHTR